MSVYIVIYSESSENDLVQVSENSLKLNAGIDDPPSFYWMSRVQLVV